EVHADPGGDGAGGVVPAAARGRHHDRDPDRAVVGDAGGARHCGGGAGRRVGGGELLVRLDTSQERAQLAAADAQRELTKLNLDRMRTLREKEVVSQAELDRAEAEYRQAEARAGEIRAVIDR